MANVWFLYNNLSADATATVSTSVAPSSISEALKTSRYEFWETAGQSFPVDETNNKVYVDDGSPKTATVPSATYTSGTALASAIQTALNTVSSGWECGYNTSTRKFSLVNAGTQDMIFSNRTNAIWDTIGILTEVDTDAVTTGVTRDTWYEWAKFDMGDAVQCTFFGMLSVGGEIFPVGTNGTVRIQANNIDSWATPAIDQLVTVGDYGAMANLEGTASYRYWRVKIQDEQNSNRGVFKIGHIYLGDHVTLVNRNISRQFDVVYIDPAEESASLNGVKIFNAKPRYREMNNIILPYLTGADYRTVRDMVEVVGRSIPFFIVPDPELNVFETLDEQAMFVRFRDNPAFFHEKTNTFTVSFDLEEIV